MQNRQILISLHLVPKVFDTALRLHSLALSRYGSKHHDPASQEILKVCPEHALKLVEHDASNLVVVDPEAEEKAAQKARAHEEAQKVKAEAKAKLDKMLDQVEKLAD